MDLLAMTKPLKPIKGQRLVDWLQRFLIANSDQLDQWSGKFTEVITAKAVAIYRKRGLIEEHEVEKARFSVLVNAAYRAKPCQPPQVAIGAAETVMEVATSNSPTPRRRRRVGPAANSGDEFAEVEEN